MIKNLLKKARASLFALVATIAFVAPIIAPLPASALYNDQTRNFPARTYPGQVVVTQRFMLNYNDPNIGTAQKFAALPANAFILSVSAYVSTAFNAASTNVITIGATTAANEIVSSGITAGTTGYYALTSAAGLGLAVTGNSTYIQGATSGTVPPFVPLYAKYTQTGTAATAGQVTVVITYAQNNDQ